MKYILPSFSFIQIKDFAINKHTLQAGRSCSDSERLFVNLMTMLTLIPQNINMHGWITDYYILLTKTCLECFKRIQRLGSICTSALQLRAFLVCFRALMKGVQPFELLTNWQPIYKQSAIHARLDIFRMVLILSCLAHFSLLMSILFNCLDYNISQYILGDFVFAKAP